MIKITFSEKGGPKKNYYFDKNEISIGRIQGNDLVLNKKNISKKHAQIIKRDLDMIILDLSSTNGTFVNGRRITTTRPISREDKIYIGDFLMSVEEIFDKDVPEEMLMKQAQELEQEKEIRPTVDVGSVLNIQDKEGDLITQYQQAVSPDEGKIDLEPEKEFTMPEMPEAEEMEEEVVVPVEEVVVEAVEEPLKIEEVAEEVVKIEEVPEDFVEALKETQLLDESRILAEIKPSVSQTPKRKEEVTDKEEKVDKEEKIEEISGKFELKKDVQEKKEIQPEPKKEKTSSRIKIWEEEGKDPYHDVLGMLFQNAKSTIFKDYPVDLIEPTDDEWQKLEDGILRLVDKMRRQNLIDASIEAHALSQDVLYEFTGLGPVEYYLTDDSIRRIFIHDPRKIFLKKDKEKISAPKKFSCHEALMRTILRLVRPLGFTMKDIPLKASGKLPDGTSWQIIMPPLAPAGPIITFEKPRKSVKNMEEQVRDSMLTDEIVEYFQKAITSRKNLLICGRNKNTRISLLNSIIQLIPANERTVLVEKQSEFHCTAEDVIVIDKAEAARNSINIFPILPSLKGDRVLWGNIEPEEIAPFLKEILNGLEGTLATAYAFSVDDLVKRFVLQLQLSLGSIDQETARALLYSTTNIIVIVSDFPDGKRRITEIAEIPADIHPDQYPPLIFKFIYEGIDQQGNVLGKIVRI